MTSTMKAQPFTSSTKDDLHSLLQQDLSKLFFANNLNELANPNDIDLVDLPNINDHSPNNVRMDDSIIRSPFKHDNYHPEFLVPAGFSPARSLTSQGENAHVFGFGQNSLISSPLKPELKSRENNYHLNYLRSEFKNRADFPEEENLYDDYYNTDTALSLMFGNGSAVKPPQDQEHELASKSNLHRNLNTEFDDDFDSNLDDFTRREPVKMSNDFDNFLARKTNSDAISLSLNRNPESTQDTRFTMLQNHMNAGRQLNYFDPGRDAFFEDENSQDPYVDTKGRSSRGLRVLSLRVKEVVGLMGKTSYKDVADYITEEVKMKIAQQPQLGEAPKEEQNVKRRVYDALNVLIASNILIKNGKEVSCAQNTDNVGIFKRKRLMAEKEAIKKKNNDMIRKLKDKQRALQEMAFKILAIKNLIRRNKEVEEGKEEENRFECDENTQSSSWSISEVAGKGNGKGTNSIYFPFLIVGGSSEDNSMNLFMDKTKRKASILSKNQLNVFGDTDVLFKLKLHFVSKDLFEEVLPQDMQKYIPSAYLEGLK